MPSFSDVATRLHDLFYYDFVEAPLGSSFRTQLWEAIFGSNFGEQLSAALGQQLWRTALGTTFGSSAAQGNSFGEHVFTRNFGE